MMKKLLLKTLKICGAVFTKFFDIITGIILLIILSPLFLYIIICLLIKQGRPIFYCPYRVGKNKKLFRIYKFRTMYIHKEDNALFEKELSYVTPFGKWLRERSLDELPQLFNVLKGDMTFIGLRPLKECEASLYEEWRFKDIPGVCSILQFKSGDITIEERISLEQSWATHHNIIHKHNMFWKTVGIILKKRNK